ncbi:Phage late control gene D protein (GPD) [Paenibacillus tianmuensis]|uniref:Phage late control gene D protein (GPD) n=1 Tax=Paenibacillus tianmuensis TaxID=624147 RepID=A0A1G4PCE9_9BACL|nr:hypothetical protein [Paenibacillus tianmuensis]SCW29941.1 Phage late control gene D protein (GPD) [Paenibacillus tianmuensis]
MNLPVIKYNGKTIALTGVKLKIVNHMNRHARAQITGSLKGYEKEAFFQLMDRAYSGSLLEIGYDSVVNHKTIFTPLFTGTISKMSVQSEQNLLTISAVSLTYQLDIKPRSRSFQNVQMTYDELIQDVLDHYKKYTEHINYPDVQWSSNLQGQKLEKFVLQYHETDWAFLKRMASRLEWGLIAGITRDQPYVHFGLPEEDVIDGKLETYRYTVTRKLGSFGKDGEQNLLYYTVRTTDIETFYTPGKKIKLRLLFPPSDEKPTISQLNGYDSKFGRSADIASNTEKELDLYVYRAVTTFDTAWNHDCVLTSKAGLLRKPVTNKQIQGASLKGRVIEVIEDKVKVDFEEIESTNELSPKQAILFPHASMYTSEGNTGWYCMPEIKDYVHIYFPTEEEGDGIVTHSVRMRTSGGDMIADPAVKIFMTKHRKAIIFEKNEIIITGNDNEMLIRLIDEKGIEIRSSKDIRVKAAGDLILKAGNSVQITAQEAIGMKAKTSLIEMDGETKIRGTKVKMN